MLFPKLDLLARNARCALIISTPEKSGSHENHPFQQPDTASSDDKAMSAKTDDVMSTLGTISQHCWLYRTLGSEGLATIRPGKLNHDGERDTLY